MKYDVIIVGGGHAGIEAANVIAKLGGRAALAIPNPDTIGLMPCNPAVGGPGKSQMVFELEAMGGVMGKLADETAIHARTLNASKGPAVQSLRVQTDRDGYAAAARHYVESLGAIEIVRGEVASLLTDKASLGDVLKGVKLLDGRELYAPTVVLCTGTFLCGVVWYGKQRREAGRQGEAPARFLSQSLIDTGHDLLRFKTGTPPRIRADSVNFELLNEVPSDDPPNSFSGNPGEFISSSPTWLTHTTPKTHRLIENNLQHSAMYGGDIDGQGPRYCPSIEDKVVRFNDKDRHLLFVEPEGRETSEVYLQGFSSSMPPILQDDMIRTLPGFAKAVIQRYAYAVEYDCLDPTQLNTSLMSKRLGGLFSAGQINGTSGYEEAAAQGFIAGMNALRYARAETPISLTRDQAYIGVMLDDIVRWGINEPYRMLTSRNEYRLLHRQDNALERLSPIAYQWGTIDTDFFQNFKNSQARVEAEVSRLRQTRYQGKLASQWLLQPQIKYQDVIAMVGEDLANPLKYQEQQRVETLIKYQAYIDRAQRNLDSRKDNERLSLKGTDFSKVASLSNEGLEQLLKYQPETLGAAQRLRGVRDGDVTALLVHVKMAQKRVSKKVSERVRGG